MTALLLISIAYFFWLFLLSRAKRPHKNSGEEIPSVSVLMAFRNEEENLSRCISGLKKLNYPEDKLEILLLDDHSEDAGAEIVASLIKDDNRIKMIKVDEPKGNLQGKTNALALGIRESKGDILAVTDADCFVEENWLLDSIKYFAPDTGLVASYTDIDEKLDFQADSSENKYLNSKRFAHLQAVDMSILQTIAGRSSNWGHTLTVLGNNLLFRRIVYEEIGGYESMKFSLTEDYALMDAIRKTEQWNIAYRFPDKSSRVFALPENTFTKFKAQRLRWLKGGKSAPLVSWFYVGLLVIVRGIFPISLFLSFVHPQAAIPALFILFADLYFLKENENICSKDLSLKDILIWEFFASYYGFRLTPDFFLKHSIQWKNRKYKA